MLRGNIFVNSVCGWRGEKNCPVILTARVIFSHEFAIIKTNFAHAGKIEGKERGCGWGAFRISTAGQ